MPDIKAPWFICSRCGHRIIHVILDTGEQKELDTQRHCYVISGREMQKLPVYVYSRGYVDHNEVCKPQS